MKNSSRQNKLGLAKGRLYTYVDNEVYTWVKVSALKSGVGYADFIRQIINEKFKTNKKWKPASVSNKKTLQ